MALSMAVVTTVCSCAYILHPERHGNTRGPISTPDLVMDILWLLPGLIPGIVALSVDFSNGAIYSGGRADAQNRVRVTANVPTLATPASLELRIVDEGGLVFARNGATLAAGATPTTLTVDLAPGVGRPLDRLPRDLYLVLETGEGRTSRLALPQRSP
jgi:hypothetical protein